MEGVGLFFILSFVFLTSFDCLANVFSQLYSNASPRLGIGHHFELSEMAPLFQFVHPLVILAIFTALLRISHLT